MLGISTNGVLSDWNRDKYDADTSRERSTRLKAMTDPQGPRSYYLQQQPAEIDEPNDDYSPKVDDLLLGSLFHTWVLEGRRYWIPTEHRRGTKAWKEQAAHNPGRVLVTPKVDRDLRAWREGLMANKQARQVLEAGSFKEQVILWDEAVEFVDSDGVLHQAEVPCKAAVDGLPFAGDLWCLKTTRATNRKEWEREVENRRYDFSAAFYRRGVMACPEFADTNPGFLHLIVSKEHPHYSYVFPLDREWLMIGDSAVRGALSQLARCRYDEAQGIDPLDAWPDLVELNQADPITPSMWAMERHGVKETAY